MQTHPSGRRVDADGPGGMDSRRVGLDGCRRRGLSPARDRRCRLVRVHGEPWREQHLAVLDRLRRFPQLPRRDDRGGQLGSVGRRRESRRKEPVRELQRLAERGGGVRHRRRRHADAKGRPRDHRGRGRPEQPGDQPGWPEPLRGELRRGLDLGVPHRRRRSAELERRRQLPLRNGAGRIRGGARRPDRVLGELHRRLSRVLHRAAERSVRSREHPRDRLRRHERTPQRPSGVAGRHEPVRAGCADQVCQFDIAAGLRAEGPGRHRSRGPAIGEWRSRPTASTCTRR